MEAKAPVKLLGYMRVSTQKQGQSGLGLEGQRTAIDNHAKSVGGVIVQVYTEVESGRKADLPELAKAIAHAKRIKAKLVIAKLDRLARNVHFVSGLMESKVDFVACDNPCANKLTVHILACIAEHEAEQISLRTQAALGAAKARGVLLGSSRPHHWEGREGVRREAAAKASMAAKTKRDGEAGEVYSSVLPTIRQLREEGQSLQDIADTLNSKGYTTLRGVAWNRVQISRLLSA